MPEQPLNPLAEIKLLRASMHAAHELGSHMHQVFGGWTECKPCEKANDELDGAFACDQYKAWQRTFEAGHRSRAELALGQLLAEIAQLRTQLDTANRQLADLDERCATAEHSTDHDYDEAAVPR